MNFNINPELLAPPSHYYKGEPVKVFWSTIGKNGRFNADGQPTVTIELTVGEDSGKLSDAEIRYLTPIKGE